MPQEARQALEPMTRDAVVRLVRLLDTLQHIPALALPILRELAYLLLVGPEGGRLRAMVQTAGQTHRIVTAAERLVREYDRPLRVEDMARDVHMSVSGFHHHFKAVTALSPLQFQKRLRLQGARRLLLNREVDVTRAGSRVGYDSPSQFSRDYRRLFGACPRQDTPWPEEHGKTATRAKDTSTHHYRNRIRVTGLDLTASRPPRGCTPSRHPGGPQRLLLECDEAGFDDGLDGM